ncbi:MAG: hypothetical protein KIT73_10590 [Burkholderiales bacterium]|nr:hypothetical protein [Burkholderiales bacterium]
MKRASLDRLRTLRTWRAHLRRHSADVACVCERQPGRFRKGQRIGGCGNPRCWLCHHDKLAGIPTRHEQRARARLAEGVVELDADEPD